MAETKFDTANMKRILNEYKDRLHFRKFYKILPRKNCIDVAFLEDEVYTVIRCVEVKCRKHNYGKYPTLDISMHKMIYIEELVRAGIECHLLVEWSCGTIGYTKCGEKLRRYKFTTSAVADERDPQARELIVQIPVGEFIIIKTAWEDTKGDGS